MDEKKRVSMHNGRVGKNGVFKAQHNDLRNGKPEKMAEVLTTWHCYEEIHPELDFEGAEALFYEERFGKALEAQNEKYRKRRQKSKIKTMDDYRRNVRTCPEETLWYIGKKDDDVPPRVLLEACLDQAVWEEQTFPQVKVLDIALHQEDGACHIHTRRVWIGHDADGNEIESQGAALREMGILPPNPAEEVGRFNNAKMTYTAACREHWAELVQGYGFDIETVPRAPGESGLNQLEYKARQEAERIRQEQEALDTRQKALEAQEDVYKQKEAELVAKHQERENELNTREAKVKKQEQDAGFKEMDLDDREKDLTKRETKAAKKEQELSERETALKNREAEHEKKVAALSKAQTAEYNRLLEHLAKENARKAREDDRQYE